MAVPSALGWHRVKVLGSGSFGEISLWKDLNTKNEVAIKICHRRAADLKEKQREYWVKEVEIMYNLDHPNVVKAVVLPDNLKQSLKTDLPPLGMEYCSGGSLRDIMKTSENQGGLQERLVRHILHDISEGLSYLHFSKLIHRDIKPENIVIKPKDARRNIYKIIDLGYAKDIRQTNHAQSLVGTIVYLAPEIFEGKQYDLTADYWSFGVLAFEIMTGIRPFFHDSGEYIACIQRLAKKNNNVIYARTFTSGNPQYLTKLPEWCSLNEKFKKDLIFWLRSMLAYNPSHRTPQSADKPTSLESMLAILRKRFTHVYDTAHQNIVSLTDNFKSVDVYADTMIPQNSQLYLSSKGEVMQFDSLMEAGIPHLDDGSITAYLFNLNADTYVLKTTPTDANTINQLTKNQTLTHPHKKELWLRLYKHVHNEYLNCCRTLAAYRALQLYMNNGHSEFSAKYSNLQWVYKELKTLSQMLKRSRQYDQKKITEGYHSLMEELRRANATPNNVTGITEKMRSIQANAIALHAKTLKTRENAFCNSTPPAILTTLHDNVFKLFKDLRSSRGKSANDKNASQLPNAEMIDAVRIFAEEHQRILTEISFNFIDALKHTKEIQKAIEDCKRFLLQLEQKHAELETQLHARDVALWNIIKKLTLDKAETSIDYPSSSSKEAEYDELLRENEVYRSQLDSLNLTLELECSIDEQDSFKQFV